MVERLLGMSISSSVRDLFRLAGLEDVSIRAIRRLTGMIGAHDSAVNGRDVETLMRLALPKVPISDGVYIERKRHQSLYSCKVMLS